MQAGIDTPAPTPATARDSRRRRFPEGEQDLYTRHVATPTGLDFAHAAQLYGLAHERVADVASLREALERALDRAARGRADHRSPRRARRERRAAPARLGRGLGRARRAVTLMPTTDRSATALRTPHRRDPEPPGRGGRPLAVRACHARARSRAPRRDRRLGRAERRSATGVGAGDPPHDVQVTPRSSGPSASPATRPTPSHAPQRRIVSAGARIVGAQAHAVKIAAAAISRNRKRFTVKLVFPGEQGNPGRLVVRLGTTGV